MANITLQVPITSSQVPSDILHNSAFDTMHYYVKTQNYSVNQQRGCYTGYQQVSSFDTISCVTLANHLPFPFLLDLSHL